MGNDIRREGAKWFARHGSSRAMLAVTLTTDPTKLDFKRLGMFKTDMLMKRELNYLHCKLNDKAYGNNWRRKNLSADIFAIREEKSGHPHIHMAIALENPTYASFMSEYVKDVWVNTPIGGDFNHVTLIDDAEGWIDYCFKHVKNIDSDAIYACKRVIDLNI